MITPTWRASCQCFRPANLPRGDQELEGMSKVLTVKIRQPSHEFTFGVGMSFIPYPLVLTPVVKQVHVYMSVLEFNVYAGF
jgi:hypothetical protein